MPRPRLQLVDTIHRLQIHRIDREAIKSIRRQSDDVAAVQAIDNLADQLWFRLVGVDAECFSRQIWLLCLGFSRLGREYEIDTV